MGSPPYQEIMDDGDGAGEKNCCGIARLPLPGYIRLIPAEGQPRYGVLGKEPAYGNRGRGS